MTAILRYPEPAVSPAPKSPSRRSRERAGIWANPRLPAESKCVYASLESYLNAEEFACWPSDKRLGPENAMDRVALHRSLRRLDEEGAIVRLSLRAFRAWLDRVGLIEGVVAPGLRKSHDVRRVVLLTARLPDGVAPPPSGASPEMRPKSCASPEMRLGASPEMRPKSCASPEMRLGASPEMRSPTPPYKDHLDPINVDVKDGDGDGILDHGGTGTKDRPDGPPPPDPHRAYRAARLRKRLSEAAVLLRLNANGTGVEPYPNPTAAPALLRDYAQELEDRAGELAELGPALLALLCSEAPPAPPPPRARDDGTAQEAIRRLPGSDGPQPVADAVAAILGRLGDRKPETREFLASALLEVQSGELAPHGVTADAVLGLLGDATAPGVEKPAHVFARNLARLLKAARRAAGAIKPPAGLLAKVTPAGGLSTGVVRHEA